MKPLGSKLINKSTAKRWMLVLLTCLIMNSALALAADRRELWQSRDQFVALESQDSRRETKMIKNDHPSEISKERLIAIMASLNVRATDNSGVEPLFTKSSLETLVPELQNGFRKAFPGDDVTFAVIGLHASAFGFAKIPKVTTGRMFVTDGKLNIIFGLVQQEFNEREDRRISPFTPGKRNSVASGDWRIVPQTDQESSLIRRDWITFGEGWKVPVQQPVLPVTKAEPVQQIPVQPPKDTRNPAERLTVLNELKNKGLITEEEYRGKRLKILNDL